MTNRFRFASVVVAGCLLTGGVCLSSTSLPELLAQVNRVVESASETHLRGVKPAGANTMVTVATARETLKRFYPRFASVASPTAFAFVRDAKGEILDSLNLRLLSEVGVVLKGASEPPQAYQMPNGIVDIRAEAPSAKMKAAIAEREKRYQADRATLRADIASRSQARAELIAAEKVARANPNDTFLAKKLKSAQAIVGLYNEIVRMSEQAVVWDQSAGADVLKSREFELDDAVRRSKSRLLQARTEMLRLPNDSIKEVVADAQRTLASLEKDLSTTRSDLAAEYRKGECPSNPLLPAVHCVGTIVDRDMLDALWDATNVGNRNTATASATAIALANKVMSIEAMTYVSGSLSPKPLTLYFITTKP